ncbi:MAG: hypothetical protein QXG86_02140 [Candidatus Woesearchaeota archaeon]
MKIIYSNCNGTFLLTDKIEESTLFKKNEAVEKCLQLERGEIIREERELLKKYPDAVLINKKFSKEVKQLDDIKKTREVLGLFTKKSRDYFDIGILLAKRKIKNSVSFDNLVINCVGCIGEIEKTINLFSRRLREWYELYNPEFSREIEDNIKFAEAVTKKTKEESLKEMGLQRENSMGSDLGDDDAKQIIMLAQKIVELNKLKELYEKYAEKIMKKNCKNLQAVAGTLIGARLIALAGSFKRLSELPASTIQLLGAEKAFFRHLKTGAKTPKHGIIVQHHLVQNSKNKGKASRLLADKISIASKVDFFGGKFMGDELLRDIQKKLGVDKNGSKSLS